MWDFLKENSEDLYLGVSLCKVKHRYGLEGMFPESESVSMSLCPVASWGEFCHEFGF